MFIINVFADKNYIFILEYALLLSARSSLLYNPYSCIVQ